MQYVTQFLSLGIHSIVKSPISGAYLLHDLLGFFVCMESEVNSEVNSLTVVYSHQIYWCKGVELASLLPGKRLTSEHLCPPDSLLLYSDELDHSMYVTSQPSVLTYVQLIYSSAICKSNSALRIIKQPFLSLKPLDLQTEREWLSLG